MVTSSSDSNGASCAISHVSCKLTIVNCVNPSCLAFQFMTLSVWFVYHIEKDPLGEIEVTPNVGVTSSSPLHSWHFQA